MGNRAVIAFDNKPEAVGLYLHWNGGVESVLALLEAGYWLEVPGGDQDYAIARLAQLMGNFFGGMNSLGVGTLAHLDCDNGDNGLFIIGLEAPRSRDRRLCIKERHFCEENAPRTLAELSEKEQEYSKGVFAAILDAQPESYRKAHPGVFAKIEAEPEDKTA